MAGQQISSYYCKVGVMPDMAQLKKVDSYLKQVEKKLQAFQKRLAKNNLKLVLSIDNFKIDSKRLQTSIGNALDAASSKVTFEVSRFVVNQRNLQAALLRAGRTVGRNVSAAVSTGRGTGGQQLSAPASRSQASVSRANFLHAGGAGGALARYGVEALPFVGGAYGMQQLNQANQNMMSANIAAESVLGPEAKARMDWLAQRSNYLGVNYSETLPQFTKFMASASPLLGGNAAQDVFSSFMQFGRTRGATSVSMNRALNAVAQMGAKGQIMQEELKGQLAEASGFGELPQLFAEAYQIKTGGSLKGADARAALMDAMQKGLVKSDILPLVSNLMNELSKGGIEKARTSSIAEQARAENALTGRNGLLQVFSQQGGEQGFAKFWKTMAEGIKANEPLVRGLAGAFSDLMTGMEAPLQLVKDFNGALSGLSKEVGLSEASLVKLGGLGAMLMTKWGRLGFMFATIAAVLQDMSRGIQGKNSYTKDIVDWVGANSTSIDERRKDPNDPLGRPGPLAGFWQDTVRPGWNTIKDTFSSSMDRARAIGDPTSPYYNDPKGYEQFQKDQAIAASLDSKMQASVKTNNITFGDINVNMPAGASGEDDSQKAQMFANMLQNAINEALPNFNVTQ